MTNHPNRAKKSITLQICTSTVDGKITFASIGGVYTSREKAMKAAKGFAGRGAEYCGDGLSIRYAGDAGTVYLLSEWNWAGPCASPLRFTGSYIVTGRARSPRGD